MAERRYSVSPIFLPKSFGPNPRENLRTLTPTQRAAKKCPSSWNATNTPRTTRNHHAFCNNNQTVSGDQVNAMNTVYAPSCRPSVPTPQPTTRLFHGPSDPLPTPLPTYPPLWGYGHPSCCE